jgi:hypothetical protein
MLTSSGRKQKVQFMVIQSLSTFETALEDSDVSHQNATNSIEEANARVLTYIPECKRTFMLLNLPETTIDQSYNCNAQEKGW